jgi:glycine/D-amino acid oxidase-like deaminating enzyme
MKKIKYLIVGQGIAGTVLAHTLEDENLDFHIIHQSQPGESSSIAAGIMNPITGKYFVKSWQIDLLLPFARIKYQSWEEKLQCAFYHPRILLRSIHDVAEQNDWLSKTADPSVKHYIADYKELTDYEWLNNAPLGYGQTVGAGQVMWHEFLMKSAFHWEEKGVYSKAMFDYDQVNITKNGIEYGSFLADQVIFCEGYFMIHNPWFNYLPLDGAKGEAVLIKMENIFLDTILKHKYFLCPFLDNTFWLGATNTWEFSNINADRDAAASLYEEGNNMLKVPHDVIKYLVGIRPTVRDRRPLMGRHPVHPRLLVFNGLGTKGTSLAPYWAGQFVEFLTQKSALGKEVNISRIKYK